MSTKPMNPKPEQTPETDALMSEIEPLSWTERAFKLRDKSKELETKLRAAEEERDAALKLLNAPELHSFRDGVVLEAAHQRQRWPSDHDEGKKPADWFWLIGYLAGKALHAQTAGNVEKALHHTISTAAALNNWHASILNKTNMRPGLPKEKQHE